MKNSRLIEWPVRRHMLGCGEAVPGRCNILYLDIVTSSSSFVPSRRRVTPIDLNKKTHRDLLS